MRHPITTLEPEIRESALATTPDDAVHIEARAFLLRDDTIVVRSDRGSNDLVLLAPLFRVALPIGRPSDEVVHEAVGYAREPWSFVAEIEDAGRYTELLEGWHYEPAIIAEQPMPEENRGLVQMASSTSPRAPARTPFVPVPFSPAENPEPPHLEIRLLTLTDRPAIDALEDPDLRNELQTIYGQVPMLAAFVDGHPASFCSAYPETETRFDLAIDTVTEYRRHGLARATAAALIAEMATRGKRAVWGAVESNTASIRLAESLGFKWVGQLGVWEAPPAS